MSVDLLVVIYLYVCCSMILFDGIYLLHIRYERWAVPRRVARMRDCIVQQPETIEVHGKVNETLLGHMVWSLRRPVNLQAYLTSLSGLRDSNTAYVARLMEVMPLMLLELAPVYGRKRSEYRAYFAYQVAALRLGEGYSARPDEYRQQCSRLARQMLPMLRGKTVFERGNACKAILSLGDIKLVPEMLRRMADSEDTISGKLLVEYLLGSVIPIDELSIVLTNHLDNLSGWIQVAIIDYMRMAKGDKELQEAFCPMLFDRMCRGKTNKEVRLAIIRYFRRFPYPPAYKELLEVAQGGNDKNWEYSAVAALSLASYPGQATVDGLKNALRSHNWYVRFNAAESLIVLGVDRSELAETGDRYAQGMLSYRNRITEIREKGRRDAI